MIVVRDSLSIDEDELTFTYSRSAGPGGQHVNKVSTKATLLWNVRTSRALTEAQRSRVLRRLATRINRDGILRVSSSRHRSRVANRRTALERFAELLAAAVWTAPPRKKTRPSRSSVERRLEQKRQRGRRKQDRSARHGLDSD